MRERVSERKLGLTRCPVACPVGVSLAVFAAFTLVLEASSPMTTPSHDNSLFKKPPPKLETRWYTYENKNGEKGQGGMANFGRKGSPSLTLKPGEKVVLCDIEGSGTIRRIWATTDPVDDPKVQRSMKLEMFWDGSDKPAVQVPMGDFFCHTFGKATAFENAFFASPEAKSYNCFIPMPFKKGAKIQLTNEADRNVGLFFEVDTTIGDGHGDDTMYFHAGWRRENYSTPRADFEILPKQSGVGRFLGCNIGVRQNPAIASCWWGEGEVKVYLDGDSEWPTLVGTGTEDFIGTGWGQARFDQLYQGCQFVSEQGNGWFKDFYGFYRFHVPDPVYFHKEIRVTIQTLGGGMSKTALVKDMKANPDKKYMKASNGKQFFDIDELEKGDDIFVLIERDDDYCATAYWYMDSPTNTLPPLAPLAERLADLP